MAAVLGGTNSLHTNALDEVLALPSAKSAQIALRTQQVIMEETGVINVADPLGGSWYVEALTDRIEAEAEHIFTRIRDLAALAVPSGRHPIGEMTSGILRGIEDGYFTGEIADAAFAYTIAVEKGEKKVVGVNSRAGGIGEDLEILRISGDVETEQNALLAPPPGRPRRRGGRCRAGRRWSGRAGGTGNMVPAMLDAVRAEATLGEICGAAAGVVGRLHRAPAVLIAYASCGGSWLSSRPSPGRRPFSSRVSTRSSRRRRRTPEYPCRARLRRCAGGSASTGRRRSSRRRCRSSPFRHR